MPDSTTTIKARLILYHKGKILLLEQTKPNGGNYTLVGGTVEEREFARQALIRESFEEAGIRLREEDLQLVHVLHKIIDEEHRFGVSHKEKLKRYRSTVHVQPSETRYVHGQMERSQGGVAVLVQPWGTIYIDGDLHALNTDVIYETALPTGHHVIRASHPTFGTREVPVHVTAGETARVVIDMREQPTPEDDAIDGEES